MERKPKTKSVLLEELARAVARWPGQAPLSKRQAKRLRRVVEQVERCAMDAIERHHLAACWQWLDRAQRRGVLARWREGWLVELWCWQHLVGIGVGLDSRLPGPPRPVVRPRYVPGRLTLEVQRHYESRYPLDPGPKPKF